MQNARCIIFSLLAGLLLLSCEQAVSPDKKGEPNHMQKSAKRGICYNSFSEAEMALVGQSISWGYNWGKTTSDQVASGMEQYGIEYCPMVWSGKPDISAMQAFIAAHPNTHYLLVFNEPNLTDQANMTPAQAAALWPEVVEAAEVLNLRLVSPAMNYGTLAGYSDPIKWLDEFFAQPGVDINDIDAISIHCYMASTSGLKDFVERFRKYNKPVWLTEFCAWDPAPSGADKQLDYMCTTLSYLEQEPLVERYSWFMLKTSSAITKVPFNQLVTHDMNPQLTPQGEIYTMFSSFDQTTYLSTCRAIHAGEYAKAEGDIILRPTTDYEVYGAAGKNGLMITDLREGCPLTYLIETPKSQTITIHHCGYVDGTVAITVDGKQAAEADLPRNSSVTEWTSTQIPINMKAGKHTLTICLTKGSCMFSGMEIE
ncbi:MAG: glycosyl hydrolase [Paludibacteraceae bacterium]